MENKWIAVKDCPIPKEGTIIVSVTTQFDDETLGSFAPVSFTDIIYHGFMDKSGDEYIYYNDITHWQPLPSPKIDLF